MERSSTQEIRGRGEKGRRKREKITLTVLLTLALTSIFPWQGMKGLAIESFPHFATDLENFSYLLQKRSDALEARLIQQNSEGSASDIVESALDPDLSKAWLSEEFFKSIFLYYSQDPLNKILQWTKLRPILYGVELSAESCSELFKKVLTFDSKMDHLLSLTKSLMASVDHIYKRQMLKAIDSRHDQEDKALGYALITSPAQYRKYEEFPSYSDLTFGQDFKILSEKLQNLSSRLKKIAASLG